MAEPVEKSEPLPPELAQLTAEAAALDAEATPQPLNPDGTEAKPPAPIDYAADARGVVDIAAEALAAFYPSTGPILNEKARGRIASAAAPVMEKYGLDLAGIFGKWGAEIGLAFALAQVAIPIAKAIGADRAAGAVAKAPADEIPTRESYSTQVGKTPAADLYSKA